MKITITFDSLEEFKKHIRGYTQVKITITFDSLEEFKKHIIGVPEAAPAQKAPEAPQSDEDGWYWAPKPKKNPKKAEKPQEEDEVS